MYQRYFLMVFEILCREILQFFPAVFSFKRVTNLEEKTEKGTSEHLFASSFRSNDVFYVHFFVKFDATAACTKTELCLFRNSFHRNVFHIVRTKIRKNEEFEINESIKNKHQRV